MFRKAFGVTERGNVGIYMMKEVEVCPNEGTFLCDGDGACVGNKKRKFKEPQSDDKIDSCSNKNFAPQSKRKIKWAVKMYCDWRNTRLQNGEVAQEILRADLNELCGMSKYDLSFALARFIREIKKLDDTDYPPNMLKEIVIMLQMYLHENSVYWKLLDCPDFVTLRNVVDNTMCE